MGDKTIKASCGHKICIFPIRFPIKVLSTEVYCSTHEVLKLTAQD